MKFVCDKCRTKYTIADEKVRRKVLKIRCKNCSNVIVLRESDSRQRDGALDGHPMGVGVAPVPGPSRPGALPDLGLDDHDEPTRLSTAPEFDPDLGASPDPGDADAEWYMAVDVNQYGPMSFTELCSRVKRGEAGGEAYIWRDGFEDWLDLQDVPELRPYLPRHPPPPPRSKSGIYQVVPPAGQPRSPSAIFPIVDQAPAAMSVSQGPPRRQSAVVPRMEPGGTSPETPVVRLATPVAPAAESAPLPQPTHLPIQVSPQAQPAPVGIPELGPAPGATAPGPGESDLRPIPLPGGMVTEMPGGSPAPPLSAAIQVPSGAPVARTPLWMIIAGIGGGLAALCGLFLVAYSLLMDRVPSDPPPAKLVAAVTPVPGAGEDEEVEQMPDAGLEVIQFQPIQIERSKEDERPVKIKRGGARSPRKPQKRLTAEQKRLMDMYRKEESRTAAPPKVRRTASGSQSPKRRIRSHELGVLYQRHKSSLKACYERALKRDQSLTELKAKVTVSIGDTGVVRTVKVQAGNNPDLTSCVKRSIKRWAFPAVGAQVLEFPLIFRGT
jgi:predicted Zn finger-like uncharacterized protein